MAHEEALQKVADQREFIFKLKAEIERLEAHLAALESEKPLEAPLEAPTVLAVVEGMVWCWPRGDLLLTEVSGNVSLWLDRDGTNLGGKHIPVTVTIARKPDGDSHD